MLAGHAVEEKFGPEKTSSEKLGTPGYAGRHAEDKCFRGLG